MNQFRVPPQSIEVERHVIGAMLLGDPDALIAFERVRAGDFYLEKHAAIWACLQALSIAGEPLDPITLSNALKKVGAFDRVGDAYLMEISSEVVSSANVAHHADIIREKSQLRRLISGCANILEKAYSPAVEVPALLGEAESLLLALAEERVSQGLVPFKAIIPETLADVVRSARGDLTGVPTGLTELDRITGGLQPTDFIILAGRPAMGKTGFGLSISWRAAFFHGQRVAFFSMEMSKKQLQQRVLCAHKNLDLHKLRQGKLDTLQMQAFLDSVRILGEIPLYIDDQNGKTPMQILSQCKRLKTQDELYLIVVDFCQLGRLDKEVENRAQEVGEFAYALKGIAKELNIPVIGLAQLNRECDKRTGDSEGYVSYKQSDLNESGKLEQAADIIGVIHRCEVLSRNAEKGKAELQVVKFRNGPIGEIPFRFNAESASFSDYIEPSFLEGIPL